MIAIDRMGGCKQEKCQPQTFGMLVAIGERRIGCPVMSDEKFQLNPIGGADMLWRIDFLDWILIWCRGRDWRADALVWIFNKESK